MSKGLLARLGAGVLSGALALTALPGVLLEGSAADCVIDTTKTYQTIRGFGGMNLPEWVGSDLTDAQRRTAFGNGENELGLTMLRVFVNPDSSQWSTAVPTAKYASDAGATVFATPWEPPSNLAESGGTDGKLHLPKANYGAYAKHLNDFGQYMKDQGVDLYSVSVQNEPDYAKEWTYWSTDETLDFIVNYGDQITSTRLMSPESFQYTPEGSSWSNGGQKFYRKILDNETAMANCDVFGTHFYGTQREWMDFPDLENSGKELWMTEVYVPNSDDNSANRWPEALDVSVNIHNGLVVANLSAYTWWYIRRSYGLMTEDGVISKRGWNMAQFSKDIRPGAKRIDATESPEKDLYISAYQGLDGEIIVVAINYSTSAMEQSFTISSGETIESITGHRTSETENYAEISGLSASGSGFTASLPAQSVSTFVLGGKEPEPDADGYFFHDTFEDGTDTWTGRGDAAVESASGSAYAGEKSLAVTGRTAAWHGAIRSLPSVFKAGTAYSFSADVFFDEGAASEVFKLTLEYKDADGETQYANIAQVEANRGEWAQLKNVSFEIPEGASSLKIYVEAESEELSFAVDEAIGAPEGTVIEGPTPSERPTEPSLGDIDGDGKITGADLTLCKRAAMGALGSAWDETYADVNQDGAVTVADAIWFAKYLIGEETAFPEPQTPPEETGMRPMSEYTPVVEAQVQEYDAEEDRSQKPGVDYGTLQKVTYYSEICKRDKDFNILLPAGYSEEKKYPVLYCMHGYWENEDRMIITGNSDMYTQELIGNAIAQGDAEEMIVVFPYIYSSATQDDCTAMDDANNAAYDNFENVLIQELMPYIESHYSVKTGKANTAITGFSMGGRESLLIGLHHGDLFGYVGAVCPAPGVTGDFKWASEEEAPSLLFITAGSNDEVVYTTPQGYHDNFTANGVPHVWHYVNGGYHGDNSIHAHIYNFIRAIFKA